MKDTIRAILLLTIGISLTGYLVWSTLGTDTSLLAQQQKPYTTYTTPAACLYMIGDPTIGLTMAAVSRIVYKAPDSTPALLTCEYP